MGDGIEAVVGPGHLLLLAYLAVSKVWAVHGEGTEHTVHFVDPKVRVKHKGTRQHRHNAAAAAAALVTTGTDSSSGSTASC